MSKLVFLLVLNFVAAVEKNGGSQSQSEIPSSQTTSTPFTQEEQMPSIPEINPEDAYLLTEYDAELLRVHPLLRVLIGGIAGNQLICAKVTLILSQATDDDNCGCAFHTAKRDVKQCNMNVKPIVRKLTETDSDSDVSCGPEDKGGSMFSFGYKACEINPPPPLPKQENSDFYEVYKFCHSKTDNKVIYTEHIIHNAKYLIPPVLKTQQKQDEKYNMITDGYTYFGSYYADIAEEYKKLEEVKNWIIEKIPSIIVLLGNFKSWNVGQQLVPVDDMAFTLQRRPTFHYGNLAPMQLDFKMFWYYICHLIREDAKINGRLFSINTGAFIMNPSKKKGPIKVDFEGLDIKEVNIEEVDVWIKIIRYEEQKSASEEKGQVKSLAIVMNTGLDEERFKTFNKELCEDNLCDQAFATYAIFQQVRSSFRCCPTKKIAEKYFDRKVGTETSFTIEGFTKSEDMTPDEELLYMSFIYSNPSFV